MKTIKYLAMAVLALSFGACSSDDDELTQQTVETGRTITITAKLAPKSAITRAVADNNDGEITVTWAVGEKLAVTYYTDEGKREMGKATITAVDESTGAATFEFTLENGTQLNQNSECTIIYPYEAAEDDATGLKTYSEFLSAQVGSLNAKLDVRVGAGTISEITGGTGHATGTMTITTQPQPKYAIFKFTVTTDGTNRFQANPFIVRSNGDLIATVTPPSSSELYVALPKTIGPTLEILASDGEKTYRKSLTLKNSIEEGVFYQTTLKMGEGTPSKIDLSGYNDNDPIVATDLSILTGKLNKNKKISIADGATVVLNNVDINGSVYWWDCAYAGITCEGDATIILAGGTSGENTVMGFHKDYPGIFVPVGKTLTIQGTNYDFLTVSSNTHYTSNFGAGIGGGNAIPCGNIVIKGGNITATGGSGAAGIGGGGSANCGNIEITGGVINATGGAGAVGIGSGSNGSTCENITITNTVYSVLSTAGANATYTLGASVGGSCGTITIGGTVWNQSQFGVNGELNYFSCHGEN